MGRVAEQIGVEKNVGDVAPDVGSDASAIEQRARKNAQVSGAKARCLLRGGIHARIGEGRG